jgi:hypothetical protein
VIGKIFIGILCLFSVTVFAGSDVISKFLPSPQSSAPMCDIHAATSTQPNFCATFPPAATCNCENHVPNPPYCEQMNNVYCSMLLTYGSLEKACQNQNVTSYNECVADWNCYWDGGKSSFPPSPNSTLCNATGVKCTSAIRPALQPNGTCK